MLKKLNLTAVALSALAAGSVLTAPNVAFAGGAAKIKSMSFNTKSAYNQVIHVVSTDKKKWNKIQPGSVQFWGHMKIDTKWPGYVNGVAVKLGQCGKNTCTSHPDLFANSAVMQRDYSHQRNFLVNTSQMPISGAGISLVPYGNLIIARCNQNLNYDGPTKEHSFNFEMTATLAAATGKANKNLDKVPVEVSENGKLDRVDHVRYGKFTVKVMCDPVERETAQDVPDDANFAAKGVKVFLSTFKGQTSKPNPGTVCKKVRVLARINTTKAGPVKFNLWTKVGNGPSQKKFVQAWSSKSGSEYKAEFIKWVSVSKTTKVQAMVEDKTNPIGQSSGWKGITLHCTGAGGGGFAKPQ